MIQCIGDLTNGNNKFMEKYLEAGKILNTHGVTGMVKFEPWFDSAEAALAVKTFYLRGKDGYSPMTAERSSAHKHILLIKFKNIDSFESAILLKDKILYCDRADVRTDKGSCFIADLKGLKIIDADSGVIYGVLNDVLNYGASDIYEIKKESEEGKLVYMPAVSEFVIRIDLESGIYVRPIEGMFE